MNSRPSIVCLCGSTRFSDAYQRANLEETLAGKIVLTIGCDIRTDAALFARMSPEEVGAVKARLDILHLRKIDLADEVLILNVGGYVGQSTRSEIEYAKSHDKVIRWLELPDIPTAPSPEMMGLGIALGIRHGLFTPEEASRYTDCPGTPSKAAPSVDSRTPADAPSAPDAAPGPRPARD